MITAIEESDDPMLLKVNAKYSFRHRALAVKYVLFSRVPSQTRREALGQWFVAMQYRTNVSDNLDTIP